MKRKTKTEKRQIERGRQIEIEGEANRERKRQIERGRERDR